MNADVRHGAREASPMALAWAPFALTLLLIAIFWLWHLNGFALADFSRYDEYYTLERSAAFARFNDWWAVYTSNAPTLKKPPLQYWMGGLLMEWGVDPGVALRIPSMLFALGVLGVTAWIARILAPARPWVMPLAVALMSCSWQFWDYARSAMLDTGAMLFTSLGFAFLLKALENPRYWYGLAGAVFLAGLQKAPTPLFFMMFAPLILALSHRIAPRWQEMRGRDIWRTRAFRRALLLAIILGFSWQFLQSFRFTAGTEINGSVENEMFERFTPGTSGRGIAEFLWLILDGEGWLRVPALISVCLLPVVTRRPTLIVVPGITLIFVLGMFLASGDVYPRYSLIMVPLLMASLAAVLMLLRPAPWLGLGAAVVLMALAGGPLRPEVFDPPYRSEDRYGVPLEPILERLGAELRDDEMLVFCGFSETPRVPPGAITHFSSNGRPYAFLREPDLGWALDRAAEDYRGPMRGICHPDGLEQLAPHLAGLKTEPVPGADMVFWTAEGYIPDPD